MKKESAQDQKHLEPRTGVLPPDPLLTTQAAIGWLGQALRRRLWIGLGVGYEEVPELRLLERAGDQEAVNLSQDLLIVKMKVGRI